MNTSTQHYKFYYQNKTRCRLVLIYKNPITEKLFASCTTPKKLIVPPMPGMLPVVDVTDNAEQKPAVVFVLTLVHNTETMTDTCPFLKFYRNNIRPLETHEYCLRIPSTRNRLPIIYLNFSLH